jgi:hypothetical protein
LFQQYTCLTGHIAGHLFGEQVFIVIVTRGHNLKTHDNFKSNRKTVGFMSSVSLNSGFLLTHELSYVEVGVEEFAFGEDAVFLAVNECPAVIFPRSATVIKEPLKNRGVTAPSQPSTEKFDYSC